MSGMIVFDCDNTVNEPGGPCEAQLPAFTLDLDQARTELQSRGWQEFSGRFYCRKHHHHDRADTEQGGE